MFEGGLSLSNSAHRNILNKNSYKVKVLLHFFDTPSGLALTGKPACGLDLR
jgi:hypothetical protein